MHRLIENLTTKPISSLNFKLFILIKQKIYHKTQEAFKPFPSKVEILKFKNPTPSKLCQISIMHLSTFFFPLFIYKELIILV